MKKIKYIFMFILMCLLQSCNITNTQVINYDMLNDYNYFVISTYQTYIEYKETLLDSEFYYNDVNFKDIYDEKYFESKGLVIINVTENSSGNKLLYKSYELAGNSFTVNIKRTSKNNQSDDIKVWTIFVSINNEEARLINSVFVNTNGEIKQIKNFEIFD